MHVVDLCREKELPDVRKHRLRHERAAVLVANRIHARGHAARIESFDDLDQLDHRLAQARDLARIETVRLAHQRTGADEEVAESGARRDAAVAMVRRVAVGERSGVLPLAGVENTLPRNEDTIEDDHRRCLAVLA
jgi:hypothetical protein